MTAAPTSHWRTDFGLEGSTAPGFFGDLADINGAASGVPQSHVLRRAFESLGLDGVLCQDNSPIIYFRVVERIDPDLVAAIHRTFWNQGVAPILVFIGPDEVHVYSGLSQPTLGHQPGATPEGFVEKLNRVANELQAFILAVETGEYFHRHRRLFDPQQRVDRNLLRHLEAARELLDKVPGTQLHNHTLDSLLCRLVFACYLFDRGVIDRQYLEEAGIRYADHLRDILGHRPRAEAKADLYRLFAQLGQDFNGDLFSENLEHEARQVTAEHLEIVDDFFRGTDPLSGEPSFWPYEFGIIPIETISAIYEHFLKAAGEQEKKEAGAFYTPRFLAELILDRVLEGVPTLLDKRFLDPACGSGIFLVGLFNRLAEEWDRNHPDAGYDDKLIGLTDILKTNLYGIDKNRSACLIAAFSLYLAFLDQLSPPDIRGVLKKVRVLPRLVTDTPGTAGTIHCADLFTDEAVLPEPVDIVVGNPPWAIVKRNSPAALWCDSRKLPFPGRQIASAFVWKASEYLTPQGRACFVLPHGLLFNHTPIAIDFQKHWLRSHAIELVLNLADYQRFLFEQAEVPAVVIRYAKEKPASSGHRIDYWAPKTDWAVTQAEIISVLPQDRSRLTVREILDDLEGADAPLIWKERYWATLRDRRLLDRLRLYPRLRDLLARRREHGQKRWIIAEGFEPFGENDLASRRHHLSLLRTAKIEAGTHDFDLFILPDDCEIPDTLDLDLRRGISDTTIFKKPLVLVTEGFTKVAFANFDIAFRHGIRGIHGPDSDADLLAFLAVYLRSKLARYFLFHTSASWGVSRARVDIDDLMRLPFPLPEESDNPARSAEIISEVGRIVTEAMKKSAEVILGRSNIVEAAQFKAETLVEEYFDINDVESILIADTLTVIIPSVRPTRTRVQVPTILAAKELERAQYVELLCETLNRWGSEDYEVHGRAVADGEIGVGMVVLQRTRHGEAPSNLDGVNKKILATLHRLQSGAAQARGTLELVRGLKVFERSLLYITKPLGRRFWTRTSALNDADEIAGSLLMRRAEASA
ncbi:MAG: N-6 DNA methylase [Paludisphaera borealis]|uniref:N-6 DNA methylase n=1 Tax=Paludisphaera borealis TaxID=1387353 RepID=UPI002845089A|nr:N-6 DNA methylase [Paludisphaera borealis]MDR3621537.1 N-6 DNA methylase [Paludisphaera borealis]